jgi:hypothetical protein
MMGTDAKALADGIPLPSELAALVLGESSISVIVILERGAAESAIQSRRGKWERPGIPMRRIVRFRDGIIVYGHSSSQDGDRHRSTDTWRKKDLQTAPMQNVRRMGLHWQNNREHLTE